MDSSPKAGLPDIYRAYTTKFDVEVRANKLDTVLGPLSRDDAKALDEVWHMLETELRPWEIKHQIRASETAARIRNALTSEERANTAITLLFDQSGSLRGQKILFAAATARVIEDFFTLLGFRYEILGFTTSRWRGGRSREQWIWESKPRNPGRLNDLLHIVYKSVNEQRGNDVRSMLRPDLLKENIDGEAILWASGRLSAIAVRRKCLIVLSDGASVDDSTLVVNKGTYLVDHLKAVIEGIVTAGEIDIAALGICERRWFGDYPMSGFADAPDDLGVALLALIERMLVR